MPTLVSLLPSDLARTRGGAERYAVELHDALTRELPGWQTRGLVAATRDRARHVPPGWTAVGGPGARLLSVGDAIGASTALRHTLRRADVIVCHQWRTRAATILRLAGALRRNTILVGMDHGAGTRLGYVLSWMPLPGADVGAHQSEFEAQISPVQAGRHVTIRGGVDERRFAPADGVTPTTDFLMVGRFLPYKGQLTFLEQLPAGASARLIGPSDSTDPDYLQAVRDKAAALGVPMRFDVSDQELVEAYRDARHTVQVPIDPRRYEGAAPPELLGLTMLEAMACGSVPICPGTGASAEFVTDGRTGRTYEAESTDALAGVLRGALEDPGAHAALRVGALAEAERWTWTEAARGLIGALGVDARR
jgi:glycosyltransferase involved in cell wall biosynthesis